MEADTDQVCAAGPNRQLGDMTGAHIHYVRLHSGQIVYHQKGQGSNPESVRHFDDR